MGRCYTIEECEDMIKKIKAAKKDFPNGFNGQEYDYWCPSCEWYNHDDWCHCDNDN